MAGTPPPGARQIGPRRLTWANGLSLTRLALVIPCVLAVIEGEAGCAALLFSIAVATDLLDGPLARRRGEASAFGGLLDHSCDAAFVSLTLAAVAYRGEVPVLLPPLIVIAFAQYVVDSRARPKDVGLGEPRLGIRLRASSLGRWNGIAYFALAGVPLVRDAVGLAWPGTPWTRSAGWLLVVTTLLSMLDRARSRLRTARDSRAAGR